MLGENGETKREWGMYHHPNVAKSLGQHNVLFYPTCDKPQVQKLRNKLYLDRG